MSKNKSQRQAENLLASLTEIASATPISLEEGDSDTEQITVLLDQPIRAVPDSSRLPRMKRFRLQLLHQWLMNNFEPCKVADIGGGKGLLGYLLMKSGWDVLVIDPHQQPLPEKYRDIFTDQRVKIAPSERVPCLAAEFQPEMARGFDLLIGMHAHGCNVKIIDAAAETGCGFVLFPCCVIGEPFVPPPGVHWLESLAAHAVQRGHRIYSFRLNFKGQNIGLCSLGLRQRLMRPANRG
jgi:hypothetical protein